MRLVRNHGAVRIEPVAHFRQVPTQPTTPRCALPVLADGRAPGALALAIHRTLV